MPDRDGLDIPSHERLRYRGSDRRGDGRADLVVTDARLLLPGDEPRGRVSVPLENVAELTHRSVDWFLVLMGVAIVGFGAFSLGRHPLGGVAFVLIGCGSLAVTWRRRGRVRVHAHTRAKPITVYPEDPDAYIDAVDEMLEPLRADRPPERPSHGVE